MSELGHPGVGGNPPAIFDGDPSKAQEFMGNFCSYCMLNPNHLNLITPFQRVVMCLTFMKGPKITDWVAKETNFMEERQASGADPNNPAAWNTFKAAFDKAFVSNGGPRPEEASPY
jgi:Ser/Thr protein kinase RdoA (MazF antagonist)